MFQRLVSSASFVGRSMAALLVCSSVAFAQAVPLRPILAEPPIISEIKPITPMGIPRSIDQILPPAMTVEQFKLQQQHSASVPKLPHLDTSSAYIHPDDVKIICSASNEKTKMEAAMRLNASFKKMLSSKRIPNQDIGEITQDIFRRIAASCDGLSKRNPSELGGLAVRFLTSATVDYWRKIKKNPLANSDEFCEMSFQNSDTMTSDQGFINKIRTDYRVDKIVDQLSRREGMILNLLIGGFSIDDIQKELGINPNNFHQISHNLKNKVAALVCS